MRSGLNVQQVAQHFGIAREMLVRHLEFDAVYGPAGDAAARGENVQQDADQVAERFRILHAESRTALRAIRPARRARVAAAVSRMGDRVARLPRSMIDHARDARHRGAGREDDAGPG